MHLELNSLSAASQMCINLSKLLNVSEAQLPYWQNGNNAIKCINFTHTHTHTHTHTPLALCLARISVPGSLLIFNHWKITKPSYLNSNGCYSLKGSKDEQFNGGCKLRFIFHGLIYRTPFHCKSGHKASSPCLAFICLITLVKSFYLFVYFLN